MNSLNTMLIKLEDNRVKSANNNLKVAVFSLYIDLVNYIKCFVSYLNPEKVDLFVRRIEINVNDIINNHHLSLGLHSMFINNTKVELETDLLKSNIEYSFLEEVKYNSLVRALKDRILIELGDTKDAIVARELVGLMEFLSNDIEYTSETNKALELLLIKYATYTAKSKHKDGSARSAIKKAVKAVKESVNKSEIIKM